MTHLFTFARFSGLSTTRWTALAFGILAMGAAIGISAQQPSGLSGIRNVYLLPMPSGLEQYVALKLSENGAFQVVTDAKKADAVLTDRIGGDFEERLEELNAQAAKAVEAAKEKDKDKKDKDKDADKVGGNDYSNQHMRPLSRTHGTVFLVDRHTGDVLWSTAESPKSTQTDDLMRAADHIASRMADAKGKAPKK
ncbi:MAG: hypothetical protein ABI824_14800 [Acidobacteriota bacterium]